MRHLVATVTHLGTAVALVAGCLGLWWWTEDTWRGPPVEAVSGEVMMRDGQVAAVRRVLHARYGADCGVAHWIQDGVAMSLPSEVYSFGAGSRDRSYYVWFSGAAVTLAPGTYSYHSELRCPLNPINTYTMRLPPLTFEVPAPATP